MVAVTGMRVTVVGAAGRMGTWFTRYFLKQRHKVFVHDINKPALRKLVRLGAKPVDNLKFNIMNSDAVMLCVPVNSTKRAMLQVAKYMMIDATLIEIASVKREAHRTLTEVARLYKLRPLCIHPLFGPSAQSLKGMKIAVVPVMNTRSELRSARQLFRGASFVVTDVDEHDKVTAVVLGLTHLTNSILAKVLADERDLNRFRELAGTTYTLQSLLTESIMNDETELFTALATSNHYTKRYARNLMETAQKICNYVIADNPRGLSNTYANIRERLSEKTDLEKSYQMMYEVLKHIMR
jgi:prephenate dehydrogenase